MLEKNNKCKYAKEDWHSPGSLLRRMIQSGANKNAAQIKQRYV